MGLVKLVLESQTKRNVQRLTQTYLTLSLQDIASSVGLPSAAAAELVILRCALPTAPFHFLNKSLLTIYHSMKGPFLTSRPGQACMTPRVQACTDT